VLIDAPVRRQVAREWLLPSRTMRRRAWPPLLGLAYIAVVAALGGLRADHLIVGSLGLLDLYNERTRRFLRDFFPFILTGVLYDSMRYFYWPGIAGRVHVEGPYRFEEKWFGIGGRTPNEWFADHHSMVLDLACGFAYLTYVAEYVVLALFAFVRGRPRTVRALGLAFLVVNVLGFITYFVFPVAPPWYVAQYGLGPARPHIEPAAAAASRFDQILGTHFFDEIYGRGVDVYGAYPSLHVAYPIMAVWFAFKDRALRWARVPTIAFSLLMCFSAVYLQHHYVTDVVLGAAYAAATLWLVHALQQVAHRSAARASSAQLAASGSAANSPEEERRSACE